MHRGVIAGCRLMLRRRITRSFVASGDDPGNEGRLSAQRGLGHPHLKVCIACMKSLHTVHTMPALGHCDLRN
jgi:hypothetical protein